MWYYYYTADGEVRGLIKIFFTGETRIEIGRDLLRNYRGKFAWIDLSNHTLHFDSLQEFERHYHVLVRGEATPEEIKHFKLHCLLNTLSE